MHPSLSGAGGPASWCDNRRFMSCCCSDANPAAAVSAARASLASDSVCLADCMLLCGDRQILSLTVPSVTSSRFELRMLADCERKSTAASGAPLQADRLEGQRRLSI